jgi:hypothetical protein
MFLAIAPLDIFTVILLHKQYALNSDVQGIFCIGEVSAGEMAF